MKAINYYVVVDKIKEAPKKIGGLELTETQNKDVRYLKGKVISVGNFDQILTPLPSQLPMLFIDGPLWGLQDFKFQNLQTL